MEKLGVTGTDLAGLVLAIGALGTAAFGIVDAMKWTWIGISGFRQIRRTLGPLTAALEIAYGPDFEELLRSQYRNGRAKGDLTRTIRQGVRIGLTEDNAEQLAQFVGVVDGTNLKQAAEIIRQGGELSSELRGVVGRFELAVDTRIDAALALAEHRYKGSVRLHASFVSVILALIAAYYLSSEQLSEVWLWALVVGIAAVPIAPMAKDLSKALQSAGKAIRLKK